MPTKKSVSEGGGEKGWFGLTGQMIGTVSAIAGGVSAVVAFVVGYFATKQDLCDVQHKLLASSLPVSVRVYQMIIEADQAALSGLEKNKIADPHLKRLLEAEIEDYKNERLAAVNKFKSILDAAPSACKLDQ
jgi:hypothetical protein